MGYTPLFVNVGKSKDAAIPTQHDKDGQYLQVTPEVEEQLQPLPFLTANQKKKYKRKSCMQIFGSLVHRV
jgi:hypothetical protein